jgi:hypothetical protein
LAHPSNFALGRLLEPYKRLFEVDRQTEVAVLVGLSESALREVEATLRELELELELILSRYLWERREKGGASLQKQARVRALCGVMQ